MPGPNFKKVARIPIEQVVDFLGLDLKKKGRQLRGPCPLCQHPSQRAFSVTLGEVNRFWCFGHCRCGGDVIQLVAQVKQLTQYEAACLLAKHFNSS
jgi:DNA primase